MAVDRNAVREGTRWWFDGEEVLVQEVTPKSVVYFGDDCGLGLIAIADFLIRAEDPAISRHERVVKRFSRLVGRDPSDEIGGAILYLLERVGPPVLGPVPAWAEPAPHPVLDVAEPLPADVCGCGTCTVEAPHASDCAVHNGPAYPAGPCDCDPVSSKAEPLEDYAIAVPQLEPLPEDKPRALRRRTGPGWAA